MRGCTRHAARSRVTFTPLPEPKRWWLQGRLLLTTHADQTPAYYEFSGIGTLTGLLSGIVPHNVASPRGVLPFTMRGAVTPTAA